MPSVSRPLVHGKIHSYIGRYCRCQLCRAAIARYRRDRRRRGLGKKA